MRLTLEVAGLVLPLAGECNLRPSLSKEILDLGIRDVAELVVAVDHIAILVAYAAIAGLHQGVTGFVRRAEVAVDARPAIFAFAELPRAHRPIFPIRKRPANCELHQPLACIKRLASWTRGGGAYGVRDSHRHQSHPGNRICR
jgi:hypothetical protein